MDINTFHRSMRHIHQDALSKTADYYGIKLRGKCNTCFESSLAKIRQRNVSKDSENQSSVPGERLLVDISSENVRCYGVNCFWVLVMDDCLSMCWSIFMSAKSKLPDQVVLLITKLRSDQRYTIKHIVKVIHCDDAGEN
jgi:hypothetical protein